jgi:sugar phosphate isomerase/epimerase
VLGSLEDLVAIKTLVPDLHFTLDIGHCVQNGENFSPFFSRYAASILDVHLHDAVRGGRGHLAAGLGELDIPLVRSVLRRVNYAKFLTIETLTHDDTIMTLAAWQASATSADSSRVVGAG